MSYLSILSPDQGLSLRPELSLAPQFYSEVFHLHHLRLQVDLAPAGFPVGAGMLTLLLIFAWQALCPLNAFFPWEEYLSPRVSDLV